VERTVNLRTRDNVVHGMFKLADVVTILQEERDARALASIFTEKKGLAQVADGAAAAAAGQEAS
jgi:threonyl-tRNA synthetase